MQELDSKQKEKLHKMASLSNDGQLTILNEIESTSKELSDKIDAVSNETKDAISTLSEKIDAIEIPEQKDHTEHMEKMMDMINEPMEIEVKLNII